MQVASVMAHNVRHALAFARRELFKVPLEGHREVLRSGGEDGLYRVHLEQGHIVEVTLVKQHQGFQVTGYLH